MNFFTALFAALSIAVAVNAAAIDVRCDARDLAVDAGAHPASAEDLPRCF
ncbi:hypothetical protein C8J57DRAFT_1510101 [Mycena rebaudengoi]|nr:hypothetical protein C8J57DRAFT_1510101 [Mycena rebaudengoi]